MFICLLVTEAAFFSATRLAVLYVIQPRTTIFQTNDTERARSRVAESRIRHRKVAESMRESKEQREIFLLQNSLFALTLISVSVLSPLLPHLPRFRSPPVLSPETVGRKERPTEPERVSVEVGVGSVGGGGGGRWVCSSQLCFWQKIQTEFPTEHCFTSTPLSIFFSSFFFDYFLSLLLHQTKTMCRKRLWF